MEIGENSNNKDTDGYIIKMYIFLRTKIIILSKPFSGEKQPRKVFLAAPPPHPSAYGILVPRTPNIRLSTNC
jgi:hypothetical protein